MKNQQQMFFWNKLAFSSKVYVYTSCEKNFYLQNVKTKLLSIHYSKYHDCTAVYSTVQKQVDSPLQVSILDSILDSQFLRELRIENKLSRIESCRTEKRFTHDWFLDNFSKTYKCGMVTFTQATVCLKQDQFKL